MKSSRERPELFGGQEPVGDAASEIDRTPPQPYDLGLPSKSSTGNISNFAAGDFDTYSKLFFDHLREEFSENFDNMIASDPTFMIADMIAMGCSSLSFKLDQYIGETFLDTVRERKNAYKLARQFGYTPKTARAAGANFIIALPEPLDFDVRIPRETKVRGTGIDGEAVTFELYPELSGGGADMSRDIVIPAGKVSVSNVIGLEGSTRTQDFQADGLPSQYFIIRNNDIIDDSVRLIIGGSEWERVQWFSKSYPQQAYKVMIEPTSLIVVIGDGKSGAVPSAGTPVRVEYRQGGGKNGNVAAGAMRTTINVPIPAANITASCSVTNYTPAIGGTAREGIREINNAVTRVMTTSRRGVTAEDFANLCIGFSSPGNGEVTRAVAALRHSGCSANIIDLYVLARGATGQELATANDTLKSDLGIFLEKRKMLNCHICIKDGVSIRQDIEVELIVDPVHRRNQSTIEEESRDRVTRFMRITDWDFGQPLRRADVIRALAGIEGVVSTDVSFGRNSMDSNPDGNIIKPAFNQIVRPGKITIHVEYL